MAYETIILATHGSAGIVTLNRPAKRNAISLQMMGEIRNAAAAFEGQDDIRCLIVTGGPKCFSSGADLNEALNVSTPEQGTEYFGSLQRLNEALETLKKPVIAAIEGFCYTGGCELALACDIRIASSGATFAITSSRIGTIPGAGGTQRLPRLVGSAHAFSLLFSAEPISAAEALRIGLINEMVPNESALDAALELAGAIGERAPLSLQMIKSAVYQGLQMDLGSGIELEKRMVARIYESSDKREGIAAFLDNRAPRFVGR